MSRIGQSSIGALTVLALVGPALADTGPSKDDIIKALNTPPDATTRGFVQVPGAGHPAAPTAQASAPAGTHASIGLPVLFDLNSATIKPESHQLLEAIVAALQSPQLADAKIEVDGHTDGRGSEALNLTLSRDRANAVRDYLVSDGKIAADRLTAVGKGMSEPADPSDPLSAANRRVVLVNLNK